MSLLKNKNFSVLWFGQLATIFGNRFSEIAIPLIVLQLTGSPWQAALVVVCSQVAPLVLSLLVGTWVESKSKKQVAMSAEAISFFTMCTLVTFGAMVPRVATFISIQHGVLNFTTTAVTLTVIIYTSQTLQFSAWQTGMVLSGAGAGNLIGVFLLNKINHFSWKFLYAGLMIVSSLGLLFILFTSNFPLIMFWMFLFDGALFMAFVVNGSARQAITPDNYLGRISGGGFLLSGLVAVSGNLFAEGPPNLLLRKYPLFFVCLYFW